MAGPIFVSFEGGEGSGKTTQAHVLRDSLVEAGFPALLVHEPGSTPFGDYLRRYLKEERRSLSNVAELLLFTAARAQLVAEVIAPTLARGINVVADRYADSTAAYQGHGQKLDLKTVQGVNELATSGVIPHLTFLLDLDPEQASLRIGPPQLPLLLEAQAQEQPGRAEEESQRGFERLPLEFHRRVRRGYQELAKEEPHRWLVLDATLASEEIASQVWRRVADLLR